MVITINELRTGSLLNYDTSEGDTLPTKIDWQDLKWLDEDPKGFNLVHSQIPISEEWLLKFGFERRDSSTCTQWFIGMNDLTHDWLFDLTWLENPVLINAPDAPFYRNGKHTIYFVHQLQNLYFALNQTELVLQ